MSHHRLRAPARQLPILLALAAALTLTGAAAQPAPPPAGVLSPVAVAESEFRVAGAPFEARGVNYIHPSGSPAGCPELHFGADGGCPWDRAAVAADMAHLRGLGVNTVRIFLNYYVFGGARAADPAYDMGPALAELDALLDSARANEIYVLPVLLAKFPQEAMSEAGYEQAGALHVAPVVRHLAGRPGLLGWDLFNEPDIGSPIDERCWDWDNADFSLCPRLAADRAAFLARLAADVRALDPGRPLTIGMGFAKSYFRPADLSGLVDFYSFHYYDDDPFDSGRYAEHWYYGAGLPVDLKRAIVELHMLPGRKPVLVSELGFPSDPDSPRDAAMVRRDTRRSLESIRLFGGDGMLVWPFVEGLDAQIGAVFVEQ